MRWSMSYSDVKKGLQFWKGMARFLSVLFHPLLLTSWLFLILSAYAPSAIGIGMSHTAVFLGLIFVTTFVLPLIIFVMNVFFIEGKFVKERFLLEGRKERILPFLYTGIFYAGLTYMLYSRSLTGGVTVGLLASVATCILLVALLSLFYKVSAHAAGTAGAVTLMVIVQGLYPDARLIAPVVGAILLSGFVSSARLFLKAHTIGEVAFGALIGFLSSFVFYLVYLL